MSSESLKLTPEELKKEEEHHKWLDEHQFTKKWQETCPFLGKNPLYEKPKPAEIIKRNDKNMVREIEIKGVKPKKKHQIDIVDSLPVGSTVNGVTKAKEFTEYEEKTEEQEQEETKKCLLADDDILTKEQEEEIRERFVKERTEELMNTLENFQKTYMPKENIDFSKKINETDMFDIVRKLFGIEKQPSRYEKFAKACREVANERNEQHLPKEIVESFEKPVREEYAAPECKVEIEDGAIRFKQDKPEAADLPEQSVALGECVLVDPNSFRGIAEDIINLHEKKNNDYGNAAHESYKLFGLVSYVIRLNDKLNRLKSLTKPGAEQQVADEKIEDTLMDLAAYAIMAIESLRSND